MHEMQLSISCATTRPRTAPGPYSHEPNMTLRTTFNSPVSDLAVLHGSKCLILERREGCIGADESNGYQVAPVRTGGRSGQQRQDESNQEASAHVDHERAVWKSNSEAASDVVSQLYRAIAPRKPPTPTIIYFSTICVLSLYVDIRRAFTLSMASPRAVSPSASSSPFFLVA